MEDDDDFGDLYSDVLPISPPAAKDNEDWILGPTAPPLGPPTKRAQNDDDDDYADVIPSLPTTTNNPSTNVVTRPDDSDPDFRAAEAPNSVDFDHSMPIPGLSARPTDPSAEPDIEDWDDSDSEDDLQIVLNDTSHGQFGGEGIGVEDDEDDDGKEDLVIVTDDGQFAGIEEQDWGEEGADGEGKELGDAAKLGGAVAGARIGYSGHGFHSQHHSMFKYIRPGAAPLTGPSPVTGAVGPAGAIRPPLPQGSIPGRGRSDWRPAGGRGFANGQRTFGYGSPWTSNVSARGFGGGLDFTLPSHKSIFDIDIESFEEKPWRISGVDISDFFNFGFDEDKWKDYCKQLDQLRLESTMQSKIRVYESGRSEQEYDPDLPPELAAAAGHHVITVDNGHNKTENGQVDYSVQGNGSSVLHAPLPTGRPIQVETGCGERLPSMDTRQPRMRDPDCVIEIVLEDFFGDPENRRSELEKSDNNFQGGEDKCFHDEKAEGKRAVPENSNLSSCPLSSRNNESTRRVPLAPDGDDISSLPSESSAECNLKSRMKSPKYSRGTSRKHRRERLLQGPSHRIDSKSPECSSGATVSQNTHSNKPGTQKTEKGIDDNEAVQNSDQSPAVANETANDLNMDNQCDEEDGKLALVDSIDNEGDDVASDYHISSDTIGDESMVRHNKKQKICSQVKPSVRQTSEEDELRTSNSENSRSKSASSRDHMKYTRNGEEAVQEGRTTETSDLRKSHREEQNYWRKDDYIHDAKQEMDRNRVASRARKEMVSQSHLYRDRGLSAHPAQGRSFDRAKDIDASVGAWQRREDRLLSRRTKDEDVRWDNDNGMMSRQKGKMKAGDRSQRDDDIYSRKHVDDVERRGHSKGGSSRNRERDDLSSSNLGNIDETIKKKRDDDFFRGKTEKDEFSRGHRNREDSGRRKRERDDIIDHRRREDCREDLVDHRRREDSTRFKGVDHFPGKHKDGSWHHREREEKQRVRQPLESTLTDREREEGRGLVRSGQGIEDKTSGNARRKEGSTALGSDKELKDKDRRQPTEQLRKGDCYREESLPQHEARGSIPSREKLANNDGRSSRHERQNMHDSHISNASDNQQVPMGRHRENTRKGKDNEVEEQKGQVFGKRKYGDHSDNKQNKKASAKVLYEDESSNAFGHTSKNDQQHVYESLEQPDHLGRKQGEDDPVSDDDVKETSRRGRSKLERWTNPKEKEFRVNDNLQTLTSSRSKVKEVGVSNDVVQAEESANPKNESCDNTGDLDAGKNGEKKLDDQDRHLDTVAKLKKRSERFKLPMPGEKDSTTNKKMECEVQLSHNDVIATAAAPNADTDVKPERPARKRRWTGS